MHWLHVNPNSDFSTFWHFLEEFWAIICRHFAKKVLEILAFVVILADNLHLADFQHFLGKVLAHVWKERSIWQTFWIKFFWFFSEFRTIFGEKLDKNWPKKCRKVEKLEFWFRCSQCIRPSRCMVGKNFSLFQVLQQPRGPDGAWRYSAGMLNSSLSKLVEARTDK